MLLQVGDETLARPGICVASVHKTVDVAVLDAVHRRDVNEFQQVIERRVNTTCRCKPHQVKSLTVLLGITEGRLDFRVLQYGVVGTGEVDLHKILIDYASGTDIQVPRLRVAHLPFGKTDIQARSLQFRVRVVGFEVVHIWRGSLCYHVTLALVTDTPTVENNEQCLLRVDVFVRYRVIVD